MVHHRLSYVGGGTAGSEGPVERARLDDWFRGEANAHSATMRWKHEVTQAPNLRIGHKALLKSADRGSIGPHCIVQVEYATSKVLSCANPFPVAQLRTKRLTRSSHLFISEGIHTWALSSASDITIMALLLALYDRGELVTGVLVILGE